MKKHAFFRAAARRGLALTYDDARLATGYSRVRPNETKLQTRFSRNINLLTPIVSAPMDTVTTCKMAVAMAVAGGIGVIHRNLTYYQQAEEVIRVKTFMNGLIASPVCIKGDETIEAVETRRQAEGLGFHSFPVIDSNGKLIGLLTRNDFDFCENYKLKVKDIMTRTPITAKAGIGLRAGYTAMRGSKKKVLPLIDKQGLLKGMYVFSDVKRIMTGNIEGFNTDENGQLRVAAAIGTEESELERAEQLVNGELDALVIDTAHGDSFPVYQMLKLLKRRFPGIDVVVGNVSEGKSALRLARAGADGIKVGQGPGSICTTRQIAGVGCPQLTAVYECASAVEKYFGGKSSRSGIPVCADGGINYSGDITIALAAGAHYVMVGRLLAGTDESPGRVVTVGGVSYKVYRGMGSLGAMQSNQASRERYGQTPTGKDSIVPEGVEGLVPYRGPVAALLHQNLEGLRRGMGYVGAATIKELAIKADFHMMSVAGREESHPHDVAHVKDAPNYRQ